MSDSTGETQAYNDLSIRTIFLIGLLSAVGLFVIITGARVLFQKWQAAEYQEKQINVPLASVNAELQEQRAAIDRYGWNATTNAAAVPVEVAMTEVVEEMSRQKTSAAIPARAGEPRANVGGGADPNQATDDKAAGDEAAGGHPTGDAEGGEA